MSGTTTREELDAEFEILQRAVDAKQRFVLRHALAQLTMLMEDGAFGSVAVHVVGGKIRQVKLEQSVQG